MNSGVWLGTACPLRQPMCDGSYTYELEDAHFPFPALKSFARSNTEFREVELPQASTPVKEEQTSLTCGLCKAFRELCSCQCQTCSSEQEVLLFVRASAVVTGPASPEPLQPGGKRILRLENNFAGCLPLNPVLE